MIRLLGTYERLKLFFVHYLTALLGLIALFGGVQVYYVVRTRALRALSER